MTGTLAATVIVDVELNPCILPNLITYETNIVGICPIDGARWVGTLALSYTPDHLLLDASKFEQMVMKAKNEILIETAAYHYFAYLKMMLKPKYLIVVLTASSTMHKEIVVEYDYKIAEIVTPILGCKLERT